jgi:hypothetical protein
MALRLLGFAGMAVEALAVVAESCARVAGIAGETGSRSRKSHAGAFRHWPSSNRPGSGASLMARYRWECGS